MSARGIVATLIVGSTFVLLIGARRDPPRPPARVVERTYERPWLTREAAAQVIGAGGRLGPLFAGIEVGGPPPSPEVRARIAEFARANHVAIGLDVVDDELAAVRFSVVFGGCCGYEGADALALRLGRPRTQGCCGCEQDWVGDWSTVSEDGSMYIRARVRGHRRARPDRRGRVLGVRPRGRQHRAPRGAALALWPTAPHGGRYDDMAHARPERQRRARVVSVGGRDPEAVVNRMRGRLSSAWRAAENRCR